VVSRQFESVGLAAYDYLLIVWAKTTSDAAAWLACRFLVLFAKFGVDS